MRALVNARVDPESTATTDNNKEVAMNGDGDTNLGAYNSLPNGSVGSDLLNEFQFDSEMGPVADISTFPPTMAAHPDDGIMNGMMSMDSILSNNFWDSVLVPGMRPIYIAILTHLNNITRRVFEQFGRSQRWYFIWSWGQWFDHSSLGPNAHRFWVEYTFPWWSNCKRTHSAEN